MDDANPEFPTTDVVLVVGANDVVNPAAKNSPGSPIYGMPILNVDEAAHVIFMKRSMRSASPGSTTSCSTTSGRHCCSGTRRAS